MDEARRFEAHSFPLRIVGDISVAMVVSFARRLEFLIFSLARYPPEGDRVTTRVFSLNQRGLLLELAGKNDSFDLKLLPSALVNAGYTVRLFHLIPMP